MIDIVVCIVVYPSPSEKLIALWSYPLFVAIFGVHTYILFCFIRCYVHHTERNFRVLRTKLFLYRIL